MADLFKVRSKCSRGHWRSGRFWGPDWEDVPVDAVTDAMLADPRIDVECVEFVLDEAIAATAEGEECARASSKPKKKGGKHNADE